MCYHKGQNGKQAVLLSPHPMWLICLPRLCARTAYVAALAQDGADRAADGSVLASWEQSIWTFLLRVWTVREGLWNKEFLPDFTLPLDLRVQENAPSKLQHPVLRLLPERFARGLWRGSHHASAAALASSHICLHVLLPSFLLLFLAHLSVIPSLFLIFSLIPFI